MRSPGFPDCEPLSWRLSAAAKGFDGRSLSRSLVPVLELPNDDTEALELVGTKFGALGGKLGLCGFILTGTDSVLRVADDVSVGF